MAICDVPDDCLPILAFVPNDATEFPPLVISNPLEFTTAKLLESSNIVTPEPGVILITSSVLLVATSAPAAPPIAIIPLLSIATLFLGVPWLSYIAITPEVNSILPLPLLPILTS